MFILLILHFCKKNCQYFGLLLFFLYELVYYYSIFYLTIYGIKKILSVVLFSLYFLYNIFSIYLNFYLYLCLYCIIMSVNFFKSFVYVFIEQQNVFILFFISLCCFFFFKSISHIGFYFVKNLLIFIYFCVLTNYQLLFKQKKYINIEDSNFLYFWKGLTKFLRVKHYKASIFFLYIVYIIIVSNLLFMNFNPVV